MLIGVKARFEQLLVAGFGGLVELVAAIDGGIEHIGEAGEIAGVEVPALEAGGDEAGEIAAQGEDEREALAGGNFKADARAGAQEMDGIVLVGQAALRAPGEEGEGIGRGGVVVGRGIEQATGDTQLALVGEADAGGIFSFAGGLEIKETDAGFGEAQSEEAGLGRVALGIVDAELGEDGGEEGGAHFVAGGAGGVFDFAKGGVDDEVEVVGVPAVGGPTVGTLDGGLGVDGEGLIGLWSRSLFDEVVGLGGFVRAFEEGETAEGGGGEAVAGLDADIDILVGGLAELGGESLAGVEVAAGKGQECAHGRVVGVEGDVAGKGRDGGHGISMEGERG